MGSEMCIRDRHPHVEVGWREILSWYPVEWVMEIVVDLGVVQQEFPSVGSTETPDQHWDLGGNTYCFLGRSVDYVLEGTVGLAVEHAHLLGDFRSASMANQFMGRPPGLSWYDTCTQGHRVINILWQELVGGGGIGRPPVGALYGAKGSSPLCGAQRS